MELSLAMLTNEQILRFTTDGFVRIDEAFPSELADAGRAILWADTGCNPADPGTWTKPVIRLGGYAQEPFAKAVNTPMLRAAYDQLVGAGRWMARQSLGTFPVRFPSPDDPGDTGWHVDASFPGADEADFMSYRMNVQSKGRALLMLFLFSDVSEKDAPTRIRVGSHQTVARILEPAGEAGMSFMEVAQQLDKTEGLPEVSATGKAGTVYLCHPFLAHAAQPHHGTTPRFLAQPPLYPAQPFALHRDDGAYSPVELSIRQALGLQPPAV